MESRRNFNLFNTLEHYSLADANTERFSIPGVGGLIVKKIDNIEHILLQTRSKADAPGEDGLLEIPAGKIRAFENIFDTLKREIKEETGLDVTEILGENKLSVYSGNGYKVRFKMSIHEHIIKWHTNYGVTLFKQMNIPNKCYLP